MTNLHDWQFSQKESHDIDHTQEMVWRCTVNKHLNLAALRIMPPPLFSPLCPAGGKTSQQKYNFRGVYVKAKSFCSFTIPHQKGGAAMLHLFLQLVQWRSKQACLEQADCLACGINTCSFLKNAHPNNFTFNTTCLWVWARYLSRRQLQIYEKILNYVAFLTHWGTQSTIQSNSILLSHTVLLLLSHHIALPSCSLSCLYRHGWTAEAQR